MPQPRGMDIRSLLRSFRVRAGLWLSGALLLLSHLRDLGRVGALLVVGLVTLWLIAVPNPLVEATNPVKVGLLAWLVCKESVLAYLGYWIDRLLHPRSRPGNLRDIERMAAEKRRAFIVCAAMIAGGLFQ